MGSRHLAILTSTSELRRTPQYSIMDVYEWRKSNKKASSVFFLIYRLCLVTHRVPLYVKTKPSLRPTFFGMIAGAFWLRCMLS